MPVRKDLFNYLVNNLRHGNAQEELSEHINQCVDAARETCKTATLTFTLKFKPDGHGQYFITDNIKAKLPAMEHGATIMYGTPDGNLQREDPKQIGLDLKIVTEPSQPMKSVN